VTTSRAFARPPRPEPDSLTAALDLGALIGLGWDPETQLLTLDPSHPLVDYAVCKVVGCGNEARRADGLCARCAQRWAGDPTADFEAFCNSTAPGYHWEGEKLCLVCRAPDASRPAAGTQGLCLSCNATRRRQHQSVDAFVQGDECFAPARPRPSFGPCSVAICQRLAAYGNSLCGGHDQAWHRVGRPDLGEFARAGRVLRGDGRGQVVLSGLPERVIVEVLFGVQKLVAEGRRSSPVELRCAVDHLRRLGVTSVDSTRTTNPPIMARRFLTFVVNQVALASADAEAEQTKDVWDLRIWGAQGQLSFIGRTGARSPSGQPARNISQNWLREAAKRWAADALVSKRPKTVQEVVRAVGLWSEHLARHRQPGSLPGALGRTDMEGFLARLVRLEATGTLSRTTRGRMVDLLALFLRDCRALGLTHVGQPMADLPDDVVLRRADHVPPPRREAEEAGRALPDDVMAQLLSAESLDLLEAISDTSRRAAIELQAGVGRRTAELCALSFECLDYDTSNGSDGVTHKTPVLLHDMPKVNKFGCRLPVHDREADIIRAQQDRVRTKFPNTPSTLLVLFPAPLNNPDGTKAINPGLLQRTVDRWAVALPCLESAMPGANGGPLPFPRDRVFPYAFRHSFAQRHADSGTPVDTLKDLLGHDTVRCTLGYYRVTARRKRDAQDRLGPLQLDAVGRLVRPAVIGLSEAEALREQVGQVAVPFGTCTEPTNVAADGGSCRFRHRCMGCSYFRTDPSYQAELQAYLAQLLIDRERLSAAVPQLADWARRDAAPSEEEIEAVRRLIRANDRALAELDDADRHAVEIAVATIRQHRAALAITFPVELRGVVRQTRPTLFPTIERAAQKQAGHG
jgi:integrase